MTASASARLVADVTSALVHDDDLANLLVRLLQHGTEALTGGSGALGVIVTTPSGPPELLSATSHAVAALEVFQIQADAGPCIETIRTAEAVWALGLDDVASRWPGLQPAMLVAGYAAVYSLPMVWRGAVVGGLNVFCRSADAWDDDRLALGQAFADMTTLAVVHGPTLDDGEIARRVEDALEGRVVVEQAKGVLAQQRGLDMGEAYAELTRLAQDTGTPISAVSRNIIDDAVRRSRRPTV